MSLDIQFKNQWGRVEPLYTPSGHASAYWYLNGYGLKEIQSSIWSAVCQFIITTDVCQRDDDDDEIYV